MEFAIPTTPTYAHFTEEEEEEDNVQQKVQQHEFNLIEMASPQSVLLKSRDMQPQKHLHEIRTFSVTTTPSTTPPTSPPTTRELLEMPTFVLYNNSKIESTKENQAPSLEVDLGTTTVALVPCPVCNRTFNTITFSKHVGICQKTATKRRKVFDSSRQRREGTDLAAYPVPKDYGLPPQPSTINTAKLERSHSPQQHNDVASTVTTRKRSVSQNTPSNDDLVRSTARASIRAKATNSTTNQTVLATSQTTATDGHFQRDRLRSSERINAKRSVAPQSEQCPHCERCFGIKAYDRHVEWCKEKALQAAIKHPNAKGEPNAAMERLQARTKYRAPCLKTKRSINRDKYSGMNSEEADLTNNSIMTQSMTSSMTSESDKYDPFLTAKRQLEELCSPTAPTTTAIDELTLPLTTISQIGHSTSTSNSIPTTPLPQNKSMTTSLNFATSTPNTRQIVNKNTPTVQSNFRRTSSLRGPRRSPLLSTRPLFVNNYRPTIQRGLSDEGPISTNFLKPEEYDEMPVRSVCVNDFALTKSPRVVRRDLNATVNRKPHLKLNLQTPKNREFNKSLLNNTEGKDITKTDSLAVFLKYERELEQLATKDSEIKFGIDNAVISKELKNKSNNALSKQNSLKNILDDKMPTLLAPNNTEQIIYQNNSNRTNTHTINDDKKTMLNNDRKLPQLPLVNLKMPAINLNAIFAESTQALSNAYKLTSSSENIDPKLINKCDNLPLNLKNLQQSGKRDKHQPDVIEHEFVDEQHKNMTPPSPPPRKQQQQQQNNSNTTTTPTVATPTTITTPISIANGNRLKRKMRLGLNQFLYDASPEDTKDTIPINCNLECRESQQKPQELPDMPTFDELDFDFEEFLSSFEQDDEQFPLFKDCKEFLTNRTTNKQRKTPTSPLFPQLKPLTFETFSPKQKPLTNEQNEDSRNREIFISIEAEQSDSGQSPISPNSLRNMVGNAQTVVEVHEVGASNEAKFSKISDDDDDVDENDRDDNDDDEHDDIIDHQQNRNLPNVQLNNAKNLMQRMQNQFHQFTDEVDHYTQQHQLQQRRQRQSTPVHFEDDNKYKANTLRDADEDSDELSSAKLCSISRTSRRNKKTSSDSAYGSLSRQRSTEMPMPLPRAMNQTRPATANLPTPSMQQPQQQQQFYKTKTTKTRSNQCVYKRSSSGSGSDTSLPTIDYQKKISATNSNQNMNNYDVQQTQSYDNYGSNNRNRRNSSRTVESPNNNNYGNKLTGNVNESQVSEVMMASSASNTQLESPMTSSTSSNPSMSSSAFKRMSKFCHECGSRFIVDQAKFCMDCGVKRIILQ